LVLWSTEVLTENLPLLFGIPFSIVIFLALLFSLCGHFLLINTWMDGWMDGWIVLTVQGVSKKVVPKKLFGIFLLCMKFCKFVGN